MIFLLSRWITWSRWIEETCPAVPARKIIEWQIPDPKGKPLDEVRRIRDMFGDKSKNAP